MLEEFNFGRKTFLNSCEATSLLWLSELWLGNVLNGSIVFFYILVGVSLKPFFGLKQRSKTQLSVRSEIKCPKIQRPKAM